MSRHGNSKSKSENKKLSSPEARYTRKHQSNPNAGKTFSPRSLFRGLTVPYRNGPGQKYLHPERHRTVREAST